MQKLILNIEESRYLLILQFLKTLDYVKIEEEVPSPNLVREEKPAGSNSQLFLLQETLKKQTSPLFQDIIDPVEWQNQQRNEWS
ncbi:MAG: hypothetical protein SFV55_25270 [Haliscomenobacter sp.]|uniref:hypothetical protein n=1 Tax=Haliscomenobacter sp. TaxID=2717303 RepID=UPI0029B20E62|nr:hypothetical protein [Haliscomenobacter sp.]MDX2071768.1 hypothetical protein [Haliscomenobacter sp.]